MLGIYDGPALWNHIDALEEAGVIDPWGGGEGGTVGWVRTLQHEHLARYPWVFKSLSFLCGPNFGWLDPTNGEAPWLDWDRTRGPGEPIFSRDTGHNKVFRPLLGASQPVTPQPPCNGPHDHNDHWGRWDEEFEASWESWCEKFEGGVQKARARAGLSKQDKAMLRLPIGERTKAHEVWWTIKDLIGAPESWHMIDNSRVGARPGPLQISDVPGRNISRGLKYLPGS